MKPGIITQKWKAEDQDGKGENKARAGNCNEVCCLALFEKRFAQAGG